MIAKRARMVILPVVLLLGASAAKAGSLGLVITSPSQQSILGEQTSIAFIGSIYNQTDRDITVDLLNVTLEEGLTLKANSTTLPTSPIAAGRSVSNVALFTVMVPAGALPGLYLGEVMVSGYDADGINFDSNAAPISIRTVTAPVPEPATLALLATGVMGAVAARRRRRP